MQDWRPLIAETLAAVWPDLADGVRWIAAQVMVESSGNPQAESPAGAKGLLQLMPATGAEMGAVNLYDPAQNLRAGIGYLKRQFDHFPEIPSLDDRLRWSFAAYTGGREYCNDALRLARQEWEPLWWQWERGRFWLMHRAVRDHHGRWPDHVAMWTYVAKIVQRHHTGG